MKKLFGNSRRNTGQHYEAVAAKHLQKHGLTLLQQNYHCRSGEIDLIMLDQQTLVFVEVRFRQHNGHGSALESVNTHKQRKLLTAARHFLSCHPDHQHRNCRMDVVGIELRQQQPQIHWVKNAFME